MREYTQCCHCAYFHTRVHTLLPLCPTPEYTHCVPHQSTHTVATVPTPHTRVHTLLPLCPLPHQSTHTVATVPTSTPEYTQCCHCVPHHSTHCCHRVPHHSTHTVSHCVHPPCVPRTKHWALQGKTQNIETQPLCVEVMNLLGPW